MSIEALRAVEARLAAGETGPNVDAAVSEAMGIAPLKHIKMQLPRYTTSLDAAVSLAREGWTWGVTREGRADMWFSGDGCHIIEYVRSNPASALTLAIVRAEIARLEDAR